MQFAKVIDFLPSSLVNALRIELLPLLIAGYFSFLA